MVFPQLTAVYAAILAIIFVVLSARVVTGRVKSRVHHGDGGVDRLNRMIRAHANFAEYVPMALIVIGLLESSGASRPLLHGLLGTLLLTRVLHPIGMMAPVASGQQFALRGASACVVWIVIVIAAVSLLVRLL